ncbi:unnamed protein product, partial [Strongylus vulgaris]
KYDIPSLEPEDVDEPPSRSNAFRVPVGQFQPGPVVVYQQPDVVLDLVAVVVVDALKAKVSTTSCGEGGENGGEEEEGSFEDEEGGETGINKKDPLEDLDLDDLEKLEKGKYS